jgi:hypothetical protein
MMVSWRPGRSGRRAGAPPGLPARRSAARGALVMAGLVALASGSATLKAAPSERPAYRDGPPPGFSGGFGEHGCDACHFSAAVNDPSGSVRIDGLPARYAAGVTYPIVVELRRPGMALGGFQLAARYLANGAQAGELAPGEDEVDRLAVVEDRGIQYLYQRDAGTEPGDDGMARWSVDWTAPASADRGTVTFNVAANAADGDDSTAGDFVFVTEVGIDPDPKP